MHPEVLTRPFEPSQIKQRPGQHGKTLSYVEVSAVIARLNEAFEHAWSFDIGLHEVHDEEVVVLGRLTAGGITKSAFGGSSVTTDREGKVVSLADDLKAAASDALKKCASLLGVGLELYGSGPEERPAITTPARPVSSSERLTSRQLSAIYGASRRRGLSKERLVALTRQRVGKTDLAQLSKAEASDLIDQLSGANGHGH